MLVTGEAQHIQHSCTAEANAVRHRVMQLEALGQGLEHLSRSSSSSLLRVYTYIGIFFMSFVLFWNEIASNSVSY